MATEQSNAILVRPWREGDDGAVWDVLKEGSYSNTTSTFVLCLRRKETLAIGLVILSWLSVSGSSWMDFFLFILLFIACIYLLSFLSAVVYLYGPTLTDVSNIRKSYFNSPDNRFWVAVCNGQIVGTVAITKKPERLIGSPHNSNSRMENCKKVAWLRRMAVRKSYRGLGIAKRLVKESIEFCKENNYDSIFLITTEVHNAARSLYSRLGFKFLAPAKPYKYVVVTVNTYEFEMEL